MLIICDQGMKTQEMDPFKVVDMNLMSFQHALHSSRFLKGIWAAHFRIIIIVHAYILPCSKCELI